MKKANNLSKRNVKILCALKNKNIFINEYRILDQNDPYCSAAANNGRAGYKNKEKIHKRPFFYTFTLLGSQQIRGI